MNVWIPLADGCEDIEAVATMDILRRAGWNLTAWGVDTDGAVNASNGTLLLPDERWPDDGPEGCADLLVIPGGGRGVSTLRSRPDVIEVVRRHDREGRALAAICAGPLVLLDAGALTGHTVTCHPAVAQEMAATPGVTRLDQPVVVSGRIVTGMGAGVTVAFALTLVARWSGADHAAQLARALCAGWTPDAPVPPPKSHA
jgi:protein deglycase